MPSSQSSWLAGALVAGFILYLAANQRLGVYWSLLTGGGAASSTAGTTSTGVAASTALAAGVAGGAMAGPSQSLNVLAAPSQTGSTESGFGSGQ